MLRDFPQDPYPEGELNEIEPQSLLTTAAALAFGLSATAALAEDPVGDAPGAKSDITIVKNATGNAPAAAASRE